MSRQSRNLVGLYFLEGYYSNMVIEAYLKLIKNASPAEDIESYAKALRKTYGCDYFIACDLKRKIMKISWNETPISDNYHLATALVPVKAYPSSIVYTKYAEGRSGINKRPKLMVFYQQRNDRH